MSETSAIKVCVRVRPFNKREQKSRDCIVRMYKNATFLTNPSTLNQPEDKQQKHVFTFDHSFWSCNTNESEHTSTITQKDIYHNVGVSVLNNNFNGYNGCILAYGQSGSGKTFTMMGDQTPEGRGLIPRMCVDLFERIKLAPNLKFKVELSYLEIYAEQIRDLIDPQNTKNLRVREHPETGPYVDGLTYVEANDYYTIDQFITYGNKHRITASTQLNDRSSRSHALFALHIKQLDKSTNELLMSSKLCLVDLAGSERVKDSGVTGVQLQESANINKSLTVLGRVINILAKAKENSKPFVPFRDSILTWLLKDTLGGNSKTVMIATISPSSLNYDETLCTLQYAYRTKQIVNRVSVNAGKNDRLVENLKKALAELQKVWDAIQSSKLDQVKIIPMEHQQKIIESSQTDWDQKVSSSVLRHSKSLEKYQQHFETVSNELQLPVLIFCGTNAPVDQPLTHSIQLGRTVGNEIHSQLYCDFVHDDEGVWIVPLESILVNNHKITEPLLLSHCDKITLANDSTISYKFKIPICAIK
jgi:hypothetical protein